MAVSSVTHNKPILPRTSDTSDLGSNRASVYSGKGLSFDGVNDTVAVEDKSIFYSYGGEITISVWAKWTYSSTNEELFRVENGSDRILFSFQTGNILSFGTKDNNGSYVELDISITNYLPTIDGRWALYTATHDTDGNRKIYINGYLIGSDLRGEGVYATGNATPHIGSSSGSSEFFTGQMSDFKFFNVALTQDQIQELYNNPEQAVPTGVSQTSLTCHLPMTEGNGSYLYNANQGALGPELISNAGFDETCQKWGTTDSSTVEISGGKAIWTNAPLSGSFVEQPLDLEVGKYYRVSFDYTSTAFNIFVNLGDTQNAVALGSGKFVYDMYYGSGDSSITFKHGYSSNSSATVDNVSVKEVVPTYVKGTINGATWVSGLPEPLPQTALMDWNKGTNRFDNTDFGDSYWTKNGVTVAGEYIDKPFVGDVYKVANTTVTAYHNLYHTTMNLTGGIYYYSVFAKAGSVDTLAFIEIATSPYPTVQFNLTTGAITETLGSAWDDYSMTDLGDGWYYLTARYTGTTAKVHYNLIPKAGDTDGSYTGSTSEYMYLSNPSLSEYKNIFVGTYGSPSNSPVLLNEGSTSGKDIFGTDISNPRASGAYNFDGKSWVQFQTNNSLEISGAITLEFWAKWDTRDVTPNYDHAIGRRDSSDANWLRIYRAADKVVRLEGQSGTSITGVTSVDGTWYHIATTLSGTDAVFYVNGVSYGSGSLTWNIANEAAPWTIGTWINSTTPVSNSYTYGDIANPRIYNYALTAEQVADNYNEKASTFGGTKVASELDAYIERTNTAGATVEAHSCLVSYLTELDKK